MRSSVVRVLLALAVAAGCRSAEDTAAPPLPPQTSGTLAVAGLTAPVTVIRDRWGVPHIQAENRDDLFFAQGYVQAQDRLFQMDLWRRSSLGRLAEVLGATFIARDAMTRRMQYRGTVEDDWAHYGPDTRTIVTAFVRGINARVVEAQAALPEAFALAGWAPELWTPEDLLNRTDAFVASAGIQEEVLRAQLITELGHQTADQILPPDDGARTVVPSELDLSVVSPMVADVVRRVGTRPFFVAFGAGGGTPAATRRLPAGSNAWAVGGERSDSGAPLLATDPHRLLGHPSLRYLVHLRAPGWNVAGATSPWLPGVVIGHNDRLAWSFTARASDTQDLFVERLNPANPRQVRDGSVWVDMTTRAVSIATRGREPFEYEEQYTPRGVVIAVDNERFLAFVVRWSGHEPGGASELAALAINQAQSWESFRAAVSRWRMPAVEFVYADVEGRIGRVTASYEPVRRGWAGNVPAPGWTGRQRWDGWTAHDAGTLGQAGTGVVVSANADIARSDRIEDALRARPRHSVEDFTQLQQDAVSADARALLPLLEPLVGKADPPLQALGQRLLAWNQQVSPESEAAALFTAWRERLLARLLALRVPAHLASDFLPHARDTLVPAILAPTGVWFDGSPQTSRDRLLMEALGRIAEESGTDQSRMAAPNDILFAHPLALDDATRERFNVGPFRMAGAADTIQTVSGATAGEMIGPSLRLVLDLADWDRARATQAPGQSELPDSPHFRDLAEPWSRGDYFPLVFSDEAIAAAAGQTLRLTPPSPSR